MFKRFSIQPDPEIIKGRTRYRKLSQWHDLYSCFFWVYGLIYYVVSAPAVMYCNLHLGMEIPHILAIQIGVLLLYSIPTGSALEERLLKELEYVPDHEYPRNRRYRYPYILSMVLTNLFIVFIAYLYSGQS
jgi:hypothetical protein